MTLQWLIWSNEHRGFWHQNNHGYTRWMDEARRFPLEAAQEICDQASLQGRLSVETETGHKVPPEMMVLAPRRNPDRSAEALAGLAVQEFTNGRDFPGNERLTRIIAATIQFDREQRT